LEKVLQEKVFLWRSWGSENLSAYWQWHPQKAACP